MGCSNTYCDSLTLADTLRNINSNFSITVVDGPAQPIFTSIQTLNQSEKSIELMPNPANEVVYIKGDFDTIAIQIVDLLGNLVLKENKLNSNTIDIRELPRGCYIVVLQTKHNTIRKKLMKE